SSPAASSCATPCPATPPANCCVGPSGTSCGAVVNASPEHRFDGVHMLVQREPVEDCLPALGTQVGLRPTPPAYAVDGPCERLGVAGTHEEPVERRCQDLRDACHGRRDDRTATSHALHDRPPERLGPHA